LLGGFGVGDGGELLLGVADLGDEVIDAAAELGDGAGGGLLEALVLLQEVAEVLVVAGNRRCHLVLYIDGDKLDAMLD